MPLPTFSAACNALNAMITVGQCADLGLRYNTARSRYQVVIATLLNIHTGAAPAVRALEPTIIVASIRLLVGTSRTSQSNLDGLSDVKNVCQRSLLLLRFDFTVRGCLSACSRSI